MYNIGKDSLFNDAPAQKVTSAIGVGKDSNQLRAYCRHATAALSRDVGLGELIAGERLHQIGSLPTPPTISYRKTNSYIVNVCSFPAIQLTPSHQVPGWTHLAVTSPEAYQGGVWLW